MANIFTPMSKLAAYSSDWIAQIKRWQFHGKKEADLFILMNAATMSA
jgi:hypothetical protein